MAGTCSPDHRYDRCTARSGRATVRADQLEASILDLIRRSLIAPDAVRQMVEILNGDIELRASRQSGGRDQAAKLVDSLERQDAAPAAGHPHGVAAGGGAERFPTAIHS